ncbi:hypothetical protein A3Q56_03384 [Intoshia linei]|uniref:Serpin domain-containing protein n=1 Tax=Intoshia linei TaxID=1819745 RepID=A0A177B5M1_9BILA|nr:hypothetical protein A3Q56_03384 [Intoshia linei]
MKLSTLTTTFAILKVIVVAYIVEEKFCKDLYNQRHKPDLYDELIKLDIAKNPDSNAAVFPAIQQYMLVLIYGLMDAVSTLRGYRNFHNNIKLYVDVVHHQRMHAIYTSNFVPMHLYNHLFYYTDFSTQNCLRTAARSLQKLLIYNDDFMRFPDMDLNNTNIKKFIRNDFEYNHFYLMNNFKVNNPTFLWFTKFRTYGLLNLKLMSVDEGAFTRQDGSPKRARYVHAIGNMRNYEDDDMVIVQIHAKTYEEMTILLLKPKSPSFVLDTRVIWQKFEERSTLEEINLFYPEVNNIDYKIDMKAKFDQMGLNNTFHNQHRNIVLLDDCVEGTSAKYREMTDYDQEIFIELSSQTLTVETMFALSDNIPIPKTPLQTSNTGNAGSDHDVNTIHFSTQQKNPNNDLKTVSFNQTFYLLMYENRTSFNPKDLFSACKQYNETEVKRLTSNNVFFSAYIDDPYNPNFISRINRAFNK